MNEKLKLLLYSIDGISFAIPAYTVKQAIRMVELMPIPFASKTIMGLINYYGEIVPIVNMRQVFSMDLREIALEDCIIIVRTSKRTLGIWVDSVQGIEEYDDSDLIREEKYLLQDERERSTLSGCIRLDNGMLLVHDVESLISNSEEELLQAAQV